MMASAECAMNRQTMLTSTPVCAPSIVTRACLGLPDDLADGIIANQLIQFVNAGERNPDQLCAGALNKLREHLFGD
jgi:hypothetical protein